MRRDVICHGTFPVTAGLAMPCETAPPAVISPDIDGLVEGKKLEACVGSVGADDTFT
jgi:hypothetical protein